MNKTGSALRLRNTGRVGLNRINTFLLLTILTITIVSNVVYQETVELKEKLSLPEIYRLLKIDLDELLNARFLDNRVIRNFVFLTYYRVVNATYVYYVNVYSVENRSLTLSMELFRSDVRVEVVTASSKYGLLILIKDKYTYIYINLNNSLSTVGGEVKDFIGIYSDEEFILMYTTLNLMLFKGANIYSVPRSYRELGDVVSAYFTMDKLIVVSTKNLGKIDVYVEEYDVTQGNLLRKTTRYLGSTSFFNENYVDANNGFFTIILEDKVYRVDCRNISNIVSYNIEPKALFKAVKGGLIFLIYGNGSHGSLTYIVFKNINESYGLSVKYSDSVLSLVPDVTKLSIYRKDDLWILYYVDRNVSYVEFILVNEGLTFLSTYKPIKGEVIEYALVEPGYWVILFTTNFMNIERRTYLVTFDSNIIKNLGYTLTLPKSSIISDGLAVCFTSLEMGKPKLYIYVVNESSLVLIRGIASTIYFSNQSGRRLVVLHNGGFSIAVIPPDYRLVKAVSRIGYYGSEDLYEYVTLDLKLKNINYINTTAFSALLVLESNYTVKLTFRKTNNETQSFIIVHYRGVGYYYVPPGSYVVKVELIGQDIEKTFNLVLREGSANRVNLDDILLKNGLKNPDQLRGKSIIMVAVALVSLITILFIVSLLKYIKGRGE